MKSELENLAKAVRGGTVSSDALVEYAYELYAENAGLRKQVAAYRERVDKRVLADVQREVRKRQLLDGLDADRNDVWGLRSAFKNTFTLGGDEE